MDGKDLKRRVRQFLNEPSTSSFLDARTTYDFLYEAAKAWVIASKCLRKTQTITTVADQRAYTLDGDFLGHYLRDDDRDFFIKYNDGSNDYFLDFKTYQEIIHDNNTDSQSIPDYWGITTDPTLDDQITGTASADGDATGGKARLTVASAKFADVTAGDVVHNTTDASDGIIAKVVSTVALDVCLFGGTDNEIDASDTFIIQPRGRLQLVFDPPPSTTSHTVTVYALQSPAPVYSDYDIYPFAYDYAEALAKYAAWLYKYRDKEPDFGNAWYQFFLAQANSYGELFKEAVGRDTSRVVPRFR
ncbi:MAG: hypothetical protein U9O65_05565 [Thermotogota bacterium]|nr:hypothetical protein [Thermotogota bacterium]